MARQQTRSQADFVPPVAFAAGITAELRRAFRPPCEARRWS